ncbi:MAG: NUDIX hydrolase [Bacteroidota bacterium]
MKKEKEQRSPTPAATIMLCRDQPEGIEVLMVRRNTKLAFAGGLWVFPGGKIDSGEMERAANEQEAAALAALRELKEETDIDVTLNDLTLFRHWTTPASEPRRFATWFFYAKLNKEQVVTIDDSEIKDYQWLNPRLALEKFERGELPMINPTILSLMLLDNCKSCQDVDELMGNLEVTFILPVLKFNNKNVVALYEGDAGYISGDPEVPGPRHRFTINFTKRKYHFEYEGCDEVIPVTLI